MILRRSGESGYPVDSVQTFVDDTAYRDEIAQRCESLEQYRLECAVACVDCSGVDEDHFEARHSIKRDGQVFFKIKTQFADGYYVVVSYTVG